MSPFRDGWTRADVDAVIARGDPEELLHAPILVSMDPPDCAWALEICITLATHAHEIVRGNAALAFGHLTRTCGALDEARVRPLIEAALKDESDYVRGQAYAAACDLEHFLGWTDLIDD